MLFSADERRAYPSFQFVFLFRSFDCRSNSVQSLLRSLLGFHQMNKATTDSSDGELKARFKSYDLYHELNLEDLWALLYDIILERPLVLALIDLDESILSHRWLLRKIEITCSEPDLRLKVLFVVPQKWDLALEASYIEKTTIVTKTLPVDDTESPHTFRRSDGKDPAQIFGPQDVTSSRRDFIRSYVVELVAPRQRLHTYAVQTEHILRQCEPDKDLQTMVFTWLSSSNVHFNEDKFNTLLEDGKPITPRRIFRSILTSFVSSHGRKRTNGTLEVIASTFRPLSIHELEILYSAQFDHRGIGSVIGTNSTDSTAHSRIAALCLRYIQSENPDNLQTLRGFLNDPPAPESRLSFLRYAIKYWPQHAQCASPQL
ncbi:hypothetical protein P280DRAFT_477114 [Massarina eburnea CBS 473.64]|uniref:Uncharacterized protein n=1 Tax=Massarina eburnea CBS 473.64 TaxID=1395130 RepID=A0A6A6SBD0_9PLEO|nr:hypothetical protein P280DRAFT_477114 [Massarina eburnea CBS 473.64]